MALRSRLIDPRPSCFPLGHSLQEPPPSARAPGFLCISTVDTCPALWRAVQPVPPLAAGQFLRVGTLCCLYVCSLPLLHMGPCVEYVLGKCLLNDKSNTNTTPRAVLASDARGRQGRPSGCWEPFGTTQDTFPCLHSEITQS